MNAERIARRQARYDALVLEGRAIEDPSVPYDQELEGKLFDQIEDAFAKLCVAESTTDFLRGEINRRNVIYLSYIKAELKLRDREALAPGGDRAPHPPSYYYAQLLSANNPLISEEESDSYPCQESN
jgi:hypothetical protein